MKKIFFMLVCLFQFGAFASDCDVVVKYAITLESYMDLPSREDIHDGCDDLCFLDAKKIQTINLCIGEELNVHFSLNKISNQLVFDGVNDKVVMSQYVVTDKLVRISARTDLIAETNIYAFTINEDNVFEFYDSGLQSKYHHDLTDFYRFNIKSVGDENRVIFSTDLFYSSITGIYLNEEYSVNPIFRPPYNRVKPFIVDKTISQ
ncbi:MAG: hypothetical protein GY828_02280 [Candidatus Gracilibacteria bacterium]|nr:hypothetical protein [Candidatus Gracilibacteria bacterium]